MGTDPSSNCMLPVTSRDRQLVVKYVGRRHLGSRYPAWNCLEGGDSRDGNSSRFLEAILAGLDILLLVFPIREETVLNDRQLDTEPRSESTFDDVLLAQLPPSSSLPPLLFLLLAD